MKKSGIISFVLFAGLLNCCLASADEAAVRKTLGDYVDVFNQKAVDKVAEFWTKNGTHTDRETGERTEGRAAIQADIAAILKDSSGMKLSATIDHIKLITPDVANVEGETTVVVSDTDPIVSKFTAILVRQGDRWLLDSIEEMDLPYDSSAANALKQLEWLIGEWVDDAGDTKVSTKFRWTANQTFLLRSFDVETKEGVTLTGTQVIGWDPRNQIIRSWSFNSNGSFGEGFWTQDGGRWNSKSTQTTPSGEIASGTYVMERVDNNSFTIQLVGHEIDGQPLPSEPAVKISRVVPETASAPTPQN